MKSVFFKSNLDLQNSISNHETSSTTLNGNSTTDTQQQQTISTETDDNDGWHLVGTFKTTTTDIKHYYVVPSKINIDNYVCDIYLLFFFT